jgi:diadenosine tetraphosphate (Ap4A) HIT family hydrolase
MVERCRAEAYPPAVGRMRSGWVVMGERQVLTGYCLLLPDPVVPHLNALEPGLRAQFLSDMSSRASELESSSGAEQVMPVQT